MSITHINGEACEELEKLPEQSVNLILTDPPYVLTANEWDKPIAWNRWWKAAWKCLKPDGAIILFGIPPFSFDLMTEPLARKYYRYDWVWEKERGSNFQHASRQPMKVHEYLHVFYKSQPTYNPIKTDLDKVLVVKPHKRKVKTAGLLESNTSLYHTGGTYIGKFPTSVLKFSRDRPMIHHTQKPVGLLEYLIRTYTNDGDLVVDCFAGYASTALACKELNNRDCISIELTEEWHQKGIERLSNGPEKTTLDNK